MSKITGHHCPSLGHGALGHPFGARPGDGDQRQMPGGQAGNHAAHEGHPSHGLSTCEKGYSGLGAM